MRKIVLVLACLMLVACEDDSIDHDVIGTWANCQSLTGTDQLYLKKIYRFASDGSLRIESARYTDAQCTEIYTGRRGYPFNGTFRLGSENLQDGESVVDVDIKGTRLGKGISYQTIFSVQGDTLYLGTDSESNPPGARSDILDYQKPYIRQ